MSEENIEITNTAPEETAAPDPSAALIEAVNANNPDAPVSTIEEAIAAAAPIIVTATDYRKRTAEINAKLDEVIGSNPEFSGVLQMMIKGAPFRAAIAAHFDPEDLVPQPGDEDEEAWNNSVSERKANRERHQKFNDEFSANQQSAKAEWEKYIADNNITEEEAEQLLSTIESVANDMYSGKLTGNVIGAIHKSMNFDKAVESATEAGKAEGVAEKVTVTKETVGDGMPDTSGTSGDEGAKAEKATPKVVAMLEKAAAKKDRF